MDRAIVRQRRINRGQDEDKFYDYNDKNRLERNLLTCPYSVESFIGHSFKSRIQYNHYTRRDYMSNSIRKMSTELKIKERSYLNKNQLIYAIIENQYLKEDELKKLGIQTLRVLMNRLSITIRSEDTKSCMIDSIMNNYYQRKLYTIQRLYRRKNYKPFYLKKFKGTDSIKESKEILKTLIWAYSHPKLVEKRLGKNWLEKRDELYSL